MHHNAREALVQYRQETQKRTDTLVTTLREVIVAYQQEGSVAERLAGIETVLGPQAETLLEHCDAHMAYADNNYLPFLQRFYKSHRATLFGVAQFGDESSRDGDLPKLEIVNQESNRVLEHIH